MRSEIRHFLNPQLQHIMKQLFTDSKKLTSQQFAIKYLLFPIILFFSWVTVGNIIEQNYAKADLNRITGQVDSLIIAPIYFDKNGKGKELRIFIKSSPEYFRLTNNFNYQKIIDQISKEDAITIFYRQENQLKWGFGKQADIYQLEYNGSVLYDLSKRHENSFKITLATGIGTLVFLGLYAFYRFKKSSA